MGTVYTDRLPTNTEFAKHLGTLPQYQIWCRFGEGKMYFQDLDGRYVPIFTINKPLKLSSREMFKLLELPLSEKTLRTYKLPFYYRTSIYGEADIAILKTTVERVIGNILSAYTSYTEADRVFRVFIYMYYNCVRFKNFSRSQEYISDELGIGVNAVADALKFLIAENYFSITKQASANSKDLHNNSREYAINIDLVPFELQEEHWLQARSYSLDGSDIGIYSYTNKETGKVYIGSSTNLSLRRKTETSMETVFAQELKKNPEQFEYAVLEALPPSTSLKDLHKKELDYILKYLDEKVSLYNAVDPESLRPLSAIPSAEVEKNTLNWDAVLKDIEDDMPLLEVSKKYGINYNGIMKLYISNFDVPIEMCDEEENYQATFSNYKVLTDWLVLHQKVSNVFLISNIAKAIATNNVFAYHRFKIGEKEKISIRTKDQGSEYAAEDFSIKPVRNLRTGDVFLNAAIAAKALNKNNGGLIIRNCRGLCKTAFGDKWEFANLND